jgi:DNA (cytosine-5)-methyltransferase 1
MSHDRGRTWKVINGALEEMNYKVFAQVIDAVRYVPQHRERVFIVAFDRKRFGAAVDFSFPDAPHGPTPRLRDVLDPDVPAKYTLTDHLWKYLQEYKRRHKEKGNGFGFGLADPDGTTRTLSARYFKDGSEILIPQQGINPRRLTPREAGRLMGFPDELTNNIVVSDTQAYRQFGNAIVPPVSEAIAKCVAQTLKGIARAKVNGNFPKG